MVRGEIEISLLRDEEAGQVNDFYNFVYKEGRSLETFLWEFFRAPAGKAIYVIAKDSVSGEVVGTQCAIPIDLVTADGLVVRTAKSEDTLVHPLYRGLSIFERMYALLFEKCKEDGIRYLWGFTSAKKPFSKLGFEIPYDHSQSLMVLDVFEAYRYLSKLNSKNNFVSLVKIAALILMSKVLSWKRGFVSGSSTQPAFTLSQTDKSVGNDVHQLIRQPSTPGFWIRQDAQFLNWRIKENPYHEKVLNVRFSSETETVAQLIFNHHKNGVWYLIQDTYAASLTNSQKAECLKKGIECLLKTHKGNVKLIRTWDFAHNRHGQDEIRMRKKLGFVHLDRGISFVWKSLDDSQILQAKDFDLSRIASQGTV